MFEPSDFFRFLRRPQYLTLERRKTSVFGTAIKIYLALLLFAGLFGSFNILVLKSFLTLPIDESLVIPTHLKDQLWVYFSIVSLIAPVLEEVVFRLALLFNPVNLSLSISTLVSLYVHRISSHLITVLIFTFLFLLILSLIKAYKLSLTSFWNKYFIYIFYSMCLIFGLIHIGNYRFTDNSQYFIAPILILPQLAVGFVLSFTRLYYQKGFLISILVHVMMNSISVSLYLLSNHL